MESFLYFTGLGVLAFLVLAGFALMMWAIK